MKDRALNPYYGATVGRVAGRIAGATFTIKGDIIPQSPAEKKAEEEKKKAEEERKKAEEEAKKKAEEEKKEGEEGKKEGEEVKKEGEEEKQIAIAEPEKPRHPDEVYPLAANNGQNCLHGGENAFD